MLKNESLKRPLTEFEVEHNFNTFRDIPTFILSTDIAAYMVKSAVTAANSLPIKAIIADTTSGRTIRALAAYRAKTSIYAQCYDKQTMRKLARSYGVFVDYMEPKKDTHEFLRETLTKYSKKKKFAIDSMILVLAGNFKRSQGANFIEIGTVGDLLDVENAK